MEVDGHDECIVSWDARAVTDTYMAGKFAEMESNHIAAVYCSYHSGGMYDKASETRAGVLCIGAAEADQYDWGYLELENTYSSITSVIKVYSMVHTTIYRIHSGTLDLSSLLSSLIAAQ